MSNAQMQQPVAEERALEFQNGDERTSFEGSVQARLRKLTNLVEGFAGSALDLLRIEKTSVREAVEELVVKEGALRWIVGVASHSNGPVRERLWADIDRALTDLEKIASAVMHPTTMRSRSDYFAEQLPTARRNSTHPQTRIAQQNRSEEVAT